MPETARTLTDDQLLAVVRSGDKSLTDKFTDEERQRAMRAVKRDRGRKRRASGEQGGKQSQRSVANVERLKGKDLPKTRTGDDAFQLSERPGTPEALAKGAGNIASSLGEAATEILDPRKFSAVKIGGQISDLLGAGGMPDLTPPGELRMGPEPPGNVVGRRGGVLSRAGVVNVADPKVFQAQLQQAGERMDAVVGFVKKAPEAIADLSKWFGPNPVNSAMLAGDIIKESLGYHARLGSEGKAVAKEDPLRVAGTMADLAALAAVPAVMKARSAAKATSVGKVATETLEDSVKAASKSADKDVVVGTLDTLEGAAKRAAEESEGVVAAAATGPRSASDIALDMAERSREFSKNLDVAREKVATAKAAAATKQVDEIVDAPITKADQASLDRATQESLDFSGDSPAPTPPAVDTKKLLAESKAIERAGAATSAAANDPKRATLPGAIRRGISDNEFRETAAGEIGGFLGGQGGNINTEMLTRLGGSAAGATIAQAMVDDDKKGLRIGAGIFGALGGLLLVTPQTLRGTRFLVKRGDEVLGDFASSRRAKKLASEQGGAVEATTPDFEKAIGDFVKKALPDRDINLGGAPTKFTEGGAKAAGAIGGGVLLGADPEDEFRPLRAAGGALAGFGAVSAGLRLSGKARTVNPRRLYERLFEEMGEIPDDLRPAYMATQTRFRARLGEIGDTVKTLQKADKEDGATIMDFLDGTVGSMAVPEKYREAAGNMRFLFDEMAVDLVNLGAAEGALAEKLITNLGTYVPRLYLQFEQVDNLQKVERFLRGRGQPLKRLSDADYFKKRKDIPEEVRRAWGELNRENPDPGYILGKRGPVTAQDIATHEFMNFTAASDNTLSKAVVREAGRQSKLVEQGKVLESAASDTHKFTRQGPRGGSVNHVSFNGKVYRQLPSDARYGVLKGRYVDEGLADYFQTTIEAPRALFDAVRPITAVFKASKVTHNPATLFRNWIGQLPLTDLAGVSPWEIDRYASAGRDYFTRSAKHIEARKGGLFGGEWFGAEVSSITKRVTNDSSVFHAAAGMAAESSAWPFRKMRAFHEGSEQFFKQLIYNHARERMGLSVPKAVQYAHRFAFDYRNVPLLVNISRKSVFGAPFISFSYKAMPRVLASAMAVGNPRQMLKFWKYPAAFAAFNEGSARNLGLVPEDQKGFLPTTKRLAMNSLGLGIGRSNDELGFQRYLPDYSGDQQLLLPRRDNFGRLKYLDLTYWLPWGDVGEIGKGTIGKNLAMLGVPFPRQIEPSHPLMQAWIAAFTNRDTFTGQTIVKRGSDPVDAALFGVKYVARQMLPQILGFQAPKIFKAMEGQVADRPDQPDLPTALGEVVGARAKPNDPRTSIGFKIRELERERNALTKQLKDLSRKNAPESRLIKLVARRDEVESRLQDMRKERRDLPRSPEKLVEATKKIRKSGAARLQRAKRKAR